MQNPTPTRQELSSYFFDRCTPEISNKVERWFFKNGNSQEAKKLLFSLWEELEDTTSSTSPEEIQAAFEQFKARLLSSAPQENKSKKPPENFSIRLDTTYCGNPHSPSDYIFGVLILSTPKRRKHSVDRKKCRIWRHQTYHFAR